MSGDRHERGLAMSRRIGAYGVALMGTCFLAGPLRGDEVIYSNDFNGQVKSSYQEWSSSPITYFNSSTPKLGSSLDPPPVTNVDSPNGKQRFLGPFVGPKLAENTKNFNRTRVEQTVRLKLAKLPKH